MFVGFFVSDGRCYRDIYPTYAKLYLYRVRCYSLLTIICRDRRDAW